MVVVVIRALSTRQTVSRIERGDPIVAMGKRPTDDCEVPRMRGRRLSRRRVESVALQLAREAGLQVTESRIESVTGNDEHVVKRFDRRGTVIGVRRTTAEHDLASKS